MRLPVVDTDGADGGEVGILADGAAAGLPRHDPLLRFAFTPRAWDLEEAVAGEGEARTRRPFITSIVRKERVS